MVMFYEKLKSSLGLKATIIVVKWPGFLWCHVMMQYHSKYFFTTCGHVGLRDGGLHYFESIV
jgi:hypothetical protein